MGQRANTRGQADTTDQSEDIGYCEEAAFVGVSVLTWSRRKNRAGPAEVLGASLQIRAYDRRGCTVVNGDGAAASGGAHEAHCNPVVAPVRDTVGDSGRQGCVDLMTDRCVITVVAPAPEEGSVDRRFCAEKEIYIRGKQAGGRVAASACDTQGADSNRIARLLPVKHQPVRAALQCRCVGPGASRRIIY
jgi:hypothetical protein